MVLSYKKHMGSRESWYFLYSILALMEPLPCAKCFLLVSLHSAVWQSDSPKELGQSRSAAEKLFIKLLLGNLVYYLLCAMQVRTYCNNDLH